MKASVQPTKITTPFANSAGSSYIRTVPDASQIGVVNGAASFTDGFPPDTFVDEAAGGYPPDGRDFNYLFSIISAWVRWENAGGSIVYDSAFSSAIGGYPKGAVLAKADGSGLWLSTADDNTSDPDTGGANWDTLALSQSAADARYAALAGDVGQKFSVANATVDTQAAARGQVLGLGQSWQDMTSSRVMSTNYTNSTSQPIAVSISLNALIEDPVTDVGITLTVDSNIIAVNAARYTNSDIGRIANIFGIIPPGSIYMAQKDGTSSSFIWFELR